MERNENNFNQYNQAPQNQNNSGVNGYNPQNSCNYGNNFNGGNYNNYNNNYGNYNGGANGRPPMPPNQKKPKTRFGLGILVGILIMVVAVGAFVTIYSITLRNSKSISTDYEEKLELISQYLDQYYIGEVDSKELTDSLAAGLLSGIDDKYAAYYDAEEFSALMESVSGNYAGIGVSIVMNENNEIEVYKVFKDSPAQKAGIKVKDVIVKAAGQENFESLDDLVAVVKGDEGTTVDITVRRDDGEHTFTVERAQVSMDTVEYKMLENKIGYIAISEFDTVTTDQFNDALDDLEKQGMTSVILDLRNNPGGEYDTVVAMADRVLPEGKIISTEDKSGNIKTEYSDEENKLDIPCVVLVNGNSASAAEVFTGALQDHGVATVIGETTYGKGVVQSIFQLSDGSGMKFTTEKYYTPNGRDINGVGITPDIEVSLPEDAYADGVLDEDEDTQLQAAIEALSLA